MTKVLFFLTDGKSKRGLSGVTGRWNNTYLPDELEANNFISFAMGISRYSLSELNEIASEPTSYYTHTQSDFTNLDSIVLKYTNAVCQEGTPWHRKPNE